MNITFYSSPFCPRCFLARKALYELAASRAHIEIEEINILAHPLQAWREGVRLVPALRTQRAQLSGFLLRKKSIADFIRSCE